MAGDIGTLVAVTHHAGSSTNGTFYVHNNHRGDIVQTRSGNTTIGAYDYNAFGSSKVQTGIDVCRFKFSSEELDAATKFSYYGYRFYAPAWQCWLNRDPIEEEGGLNLYNYVGNNPANRIDSLGLIEEGAPELAAEPTLLMDNNAIQEARMAAQKAEQALQNKLHHIFDKPGHKLDCVLKQFGGDKKKAFDAINNALKGQKFMGNQLFETTVKIGEKTVTVIGKVVNGVANIGTAYIP